MWNVKCGTSNTGISSETTETREKFYEKMGWNYGITSETTITGITSETTIPGISSEPTETRESRVSRRRPALRLPPNALSFKASLTFDAVALPNFRSTSLAAKAALVRTSIKTLAHSR